MKKYLLPLILILLLTFALIGNCWVAGYDQRVKLTIDHTKIDATLTNFPVTAFFTDAQAEEIFVEFDADEDYNKICFTKNDGTTVLFAECELFDDLEQKAIYHISIEGWDISSTEDTDIYVYYDNDYVEVWTKQGSVIEPAIGWDSVGEPNVIYEGNPQILTEEENVFKMWYRRYDYSEIEDCQVCYAESANGTSWTKYGSNPVVGVEGELNTCPFVFKDGSTYYMYVHSDWDNIDKYSSADGLSWSKDKDNTLSVGAGGQWDDNALGNLFVWKEGSNDWRMLYDAKTGGEGSWKIGYATSTDGETWSKSGSNPVLSDAEGMVGHPEVHKINSTYYMWHQSSASGNLPTDIGYATSTNLTSWTEYGGNPRFWRTLAIEGMGNAEGQTADMSIVEVNGTTYMFYGAVPDQTPPPDQTIALAESTYNLVQIVQSQGMNHTGGIDSIQSHYVWDDYFKAVYHKVDATTSTVLDSTSNNNDGTKKGANEPQQVAGKVSFGQDYDGSDDRIQCADSDSLSIIGNLTISVLLNPTNLPATDALMSLVNKYDNAGSGVLSGYELRLYNASGVQKIGLFTGKSGVGGGGDINYTMSTGTWYHIVGVYDGSNSKIYVNGEYIDQAANTVDPDDNAKLLNIGNFGWWTATSSELGRYFDGLIDETTIDYIARTADWIKASYHSLWDTLLTYGSEETSEEEANAIFFGTNS